MIIKIENFGPVKEFTFDTEKKFHLIVGDNNVGKSYVLTVFYFVIKSLLEYSVFSRRVYFFTEYAEEHFDTDFKEAQELKLKIKDKKSGTYDINSLYQQFAREILQHTFAEDFSKRIKSSYFEHSSIANSYSECQTAKVTISLKGLTFVIEGNVDEFKVTSVTLDYDVVLRLSKQNRSPKLSEDTFVIYSLVGKTQDEIVQSIRSTCTHRVFGSLSDATDHVLDIDYLPASRSGLYQALSAFGQIIAELSKSRSFLTAKIELPGISGQLSDYFIKLTNIVSSESNPELFDNLATSIENEVLKGRIEYDFEEKKLYYRPTGTALRLDISSTSSMVSETAPIVAYIRHIIAWDKVGSTHKTRTRWRSKAFNPSARKILIIEEPEAHLHPDNQIKMTSFYADLAQMGVSIIMTSHSNYVFNKSSNLVIQGKLSSKDVKCDLFRMDQDGSTGEQQAVDDYGIDDHNFSDASEKLLNERLELLTNKDSDN